MKKNLWVLALVLLVITTPRPAFAYLDPGTGSIMLQALLGGVAGALVIGRLYWQRVKELLGFKTAPEENGEAENGDRGQP